MPGTMVILRGTHELRGRLELVVVIGVEADKLSEGALNSKRYDANWELVYRNDAPPPMTHIDGPRALLTGVK